MARRAQAHPKSFAGGKVGSDLVKWRFGAQAVDQLPLAPTKSLPDALPIDKHSAFADDVQEQSRALPGIGKPDDLNIRCDGGLQSRAEIGEPAQVVVAEIDDDVNVAGIRFAAGGE